MRKLRLGKTSLMVSEIGIGGIPLAKVSEEKAVQIVHRALELNINFIDTANAYKDSEEKIGYAINNCRDKLVIATKSARRSKEELLKNIDNSLKMLQTDRIDLFQIHQVSGDEEIEKVFDLGGALEGALEAKQAGKILHIGVTSHRLESAVKLIQTDQFETIQFPGNFIETDYFTTLYPEALKRDMGCIVMKPLGGGELSNANLCFKYLQQYPDCIPIPGISELEEIEEIVNLYDNKEALTLQELEEIEIIKNTVGTNFCRRCCYCEPCPQGVGIFVGMAIKRIVNNYGKNYKPEWFVNGVKSINNCTKCGKCEKQCPYELPIIKTLADHKKFYEQEVGFSD